jgi:GDP-4-dehydro-6-deoxy-D-mannose reductase
VDVEQTGELADPDTLRALVRDAAPDVILHLAGAAPPAPASQLWTDNAAAALHLLEAVAAARPSARILLVGSAAEYGPTDRRPAEESRPARPVNEYGRSKLAQTLLGRQYAHDAGLHIVIARTFNVFGPGMPARTVIGAACAQLAGGAAADALRLGRLDSFRDFIDVRDAVRLYWQLALRGAAGEVYNVCSGVARQVGAVVDQLFRLGGRPPVDGRQGSRFVSSEDVEYSCGDTTKLAALLGPPPARDFDASLGDTLASFVRQALPERIAAV